MTAISPYAPPGRKPHGAVNVHKRSRAATATGAVGLALVILKFWKHIPCLPKVIQNLPKGLREKLQFLLQNLPIGLKGTLVFVLKILVQSLTTFKERLIMTGDEEEVTAALRSFTIDSSAEENTTARGEDDDESSSESEFTETKHGDQASAAIIRKNQNQIQSILRYWFGQYAPEQAEKKLWMISAQSTVWRNKVDQEIAEQFGQILLELTAATDEDETSPSTWDQWCNDSEMYGYQGKMAAIIVLDQFSRHVSRYKKNGNSVRADGDPQSLQLLPDQTAIDRMAFNSAKLFMEKHVMEISSGMIPMPMRIFALMPFRHVKMMKFVEYVQGRIIILEELDQQNNAMLKRFRKATNRRMAVLQDESRRTGNGTKQTDFSNTDILEHVAFTPKNMDDAVAHSLYQTIQNFLDDRGIHPAPPGAIGEHPTTPMIISLSGGVDSMVIAAVLSHITQAGRYRLQLTAVHIDYANRPESAAEAAYVGTYCEQLGIKYVCRRIEEVTRGETARDEYEQVARTARYDFYRQTVQECRQAADHHGDTTSSAASTIEVGVLLGHHRGDLRENVLSNAHKGNGPLDLSGMTAVSQNDGVSLYRPLLPLEKTSVFDYAHRFGVPYFKDTTPHWSTRGKLRNKLIPLLEEIYGEGSMNNLSNLAVESDECRALMQSAVLGPFLDQVRCLPMGISFDTTAWKSQGYFFWKFVLREALHSGGIGMFTAKSVVSFMERIQANKVKEGWLQCRKDCGVFLRRDGKVFCLYPASFPWRKADTYTVGDGDGGVTVGYSPEDSVVIGPWRVSVDLQNVPETQRANKLSTKAIGGMDDFMAGSIEYYLEAPTWWHTEKESFEPRPLVFTKFTKASRPKAWKSIDMKIQDILPLLGNDEEATKAIQDPVGCGAVNDEGAINPTVIVRVTLRLETPPSR